jgi:hypothetical protein
MPSTFFHPITGEALNLSELEFEHYLYLSATSWATYLPVGHAEEMICQDLADLSWTHARLRQVDAVTPCISPEFLDELERRIQANLVKLSVLQTRRLQPKRKSRRKTEPK